MEKKRLTKKSFSELLETIAQKVEEETNNKEAAEIVRSFRIAG